MTQNNSDAIFRAIANRYTALDGQALRKELHALDRRAAIPTPRLDAKIRELLPRRPRWHVWGLVAACLALIVLVPWLMSRSPAQMSSGSQSQTHSSAPDPGDTSDIIPLSFTLPQSMSVAGVELDRGTSVYMLHDEAHDDVVMMLSHASDPLDTTGLRPLDIGRETVYVKVEDGYNLVTFQKDGVTYELTCKYDVNTLIYLSSYIL